MIILVGASASGKTEVAKILRSEYGLQKVITHTTREKRVGEVNGVDYFFVSKKKFLELKNSGFFVETTEYNGNYYGTGSDQLKDDKVLILDPNGLNAFRAREDRHIITFLFQVDQLTRYDRMIERGDSQDNARRRITNDDKEFTLSNVGRTDFIIDSENYSLEEVSNKVYKLYMLSINV